MELGYKVRSSPIKELLYITHKGKRRNYQIKPQKHSEHEIIYVDYGKIFLSLDGQNIILRPGQCIFIREGQRHEFHGLDGAPFDYLNIGYRGRFPGELEKVPLKANSVAIETLERLKRESLSGLKHSLDISACLLAEFIYLMSRKNALPQGEDSLQARNNIIYHSKAVKEAMALIQREFSRSIKMSELASSAGLSKSYLRALIQKETGQNYSYHLQKTRINEAKRLLRESPQSISEIPLAVGYNSMPFFYKMFRKFTGMTPLEYAKSLGDPEE